MSLDYGSEALSLYVRIAEKLADTSHGRLIPLPAHDPRDLVESIVRQAETLKWSDMIDGQQTDDRTVELGAYVIAYYLARARARELDITAGDEEAA